MYYASIILFLFIVGCYVYNYNPFSFSDSELQWYREKILFRQTELNNDKKIKEFLSVVEETSTDADRREIAQDLYEINTWTTEERTEAINLIMDEYEFNLNIKI